MDKQQKTYWEHGDFSTPYQMGPQKHRLYMLDLLHNKGVESLLDVGCGTGPIYELNLAQFPMRKPFVYKGTDYSWRMIDTAKGLFPEGDFEVQDMRDLKEEDNSWDCVLLMHSLDHTDDYKAAIAEAARVAKKYVCIILWRSLRDSGTNLNDRNSYGRESGFWEDTHLQEYSMEVLEEEFKKNNLEVEHLAEGEEVNDPNRYNSLFLLRKK